MNLILKSILIGLSIILSILLSIGFIAIILIAKNLIICFWRAMEGEREELKIKILTKLEKVKKKEKNKWKKKELGKQLR